jgi:hypothetical protein
MPRVSAWFVRASLCHLVGGFTLGALLLTNKGLSIGSWVWTLRQAHIEMLLVGWIIQLVMGVAIWIFPRVSLRASPPRGGSASTAWLALALLNLGVLLVASGGIGGIGGAAGRLSEIGAAASFATHLWRRVAPAGLSAM